MTTLLFEGLSGAFRLRDAVVLATEGFRAELERDHVPSGVITTVTPDRLRAKQDPASRLAALAAEAVAARRGEPAADRDPWVEGVFVSSRRGNQSSVRAFAGALAAGRRSPSTFSVSGYNIVAQSAARALGAQGPSVVLAGRRATLDGALFLAALRLSTQVVSVAHAGHVTWLPGPDGKGGEGLAVFGTVERVEPTGYEQHVVRLVPAALYDAPTAADEDEPPTEDRPGVESFDPERFVAEGAITASGPEDFAAVHRVVPGILHELVTGVGR
ncbi:hypothetical protein ACN20G_13430 [Streptomyces sp. BI20]|uniref:hypothetical protein n=1 Tax=Streptomyces sp. BI20 TaxID=3403460 RepID=UPI003C7290F5